MNNLHSENKQHKIPFLIILIQLLALGTIYFFKIKTINQRFIYLFPALTNGTLIFGLWCMSQAISVTLHLPHQIHFYRWWIHSKLSDSNERGLSTNGFPFLGFIPIPKLNVFQLIVVGYIYTVVLCTTFIFSICATCNSFLGYFFIERMTLVSGLILSCLYHGQLWAERSSSYHRETLSVAVWLYAVLSPSLEDLGPVLRWHIGVLYGISVVQKIAMSFVMGNWWASNSPHGFLWKAMWAKPFFPHLQRLLFTWPSLAHFGGIASMIAELLPLVFFFVNRFEIGCLAVFLLLGMHTFIYLIQGIDYISFWTPCVLLLLLNPSGSIPTSVTAWPVLTLLGVQTLFAIMTAENFNINWPPLMSCPMFVTIARLDDKFPQTYVLQGQSDIHFERIEWMYPYATEEFGMGFPETDVNKMPMPFISFGQGIGKNKENLQIVPSVVHHHYKNNSSEFYFISNIPNLEKHQDLLQDLEQLVFDLHNRKSKYKPYQHLNELVDRMERIRTKFFQTYK